MNNNQFIVTAYLIYLPVALLLTWYVAHTLFKNGLVFMRDIFFGREEIAIATNSLFKIGFYLLNLGFALYILKINAYLEGTQSTIEALSYKIGGFSIYLGVMLFFNLYMFFRGKRVSKQRYEERQMAQRLYNQGGQATT
jgi:predicted PurR-regulated permease PerM